MSSPGASFRNDWIAYWDQPNFVSESLYSIYARHFVRMSAPFMEYGPDDQLLDIGCGGGHIDAELGGQVADLIGIDTSPRLVAECRVRMSGRPNASFATLDADRPFDFDFLGPRKFNKIICVSVVQYYREPTDLARLIAGVKRIATPGARLLVADVAVENTLLRDVFGSLYGGIRSGCLFEKLRFLWQAGTSSYAQRRRRSKLLSLSRAELDRALSHYGAPGTLIRAQLTLNSSRRHILYTL